VVCHHGFVTGSLPTNGTPDHPGVAGAVSGEWVEVYPPDGEPPEADEPALDPEPRSRLGPVATGLFGAALLLVLLGSVLPLFRAAERVSFQVVDSLTVSAWRFTSSSLGPERPLTSHTAPTPVPLGYPLVIAGLLLVAAAGLGLRSGWRPASLRPAKLVGVIAATFLAGLVFALGMFEIAWRTLLSSAADDTAGGLLAIPGQGFWVLVVAALAAIAAAVLTFRIRPAEPVAAGGEWGSGEVDPVGDVPPGQPAEWPVVAVIPVDERSNW
jgi:hypothetical protein